MQVNPFAAIRDLGEVIELQAPVPGRGLQHCVVSREAEPSLFALLQDILRCSTAGFDGEVSPAHFARLTQMGFLVPVDQVPARPTYRCPGNDSAAQTVPGDHAYVTRGEAPAPVSPADLVWIRDEVSDIVYPFHDSEVASSLADAATNEWRLVPVPARARFGLACSSEVDRLRRGWANAVATARDDLESRHWCVLERVWNRYQTAALREYIQTLILQGFATDGDEHVARRWSLHNDAMARQVQAALLPLAEKLAGKALQLSYTYLSAYRPGAFLESHIDRQQSAVALSLVVDESGPSSNSSGWPLVFESNGRNEVALGAPGDLIAFRGTEIKHGRPELPEGSSYVVALLFYVDADFSGALD